MALMVARSAGLKTNRELHAAVLELRSWLRADNASPPCSAAHLQDQVPAHPDHARAGPAEFQDAVASRGRYFRLLALKTNPIIPSGSNTMLVGSGAIA
jgi:hypothetical protein